MSKEKDWVGNKNSIYKTLGASNHTDKEREDNDFYATDPKALRLFLEKLKEDNIVLNKYIWECASGLNHLANTLKEYGYIVTSTDLIDRGCQDKVLDFLTVEFNTKKPITILTNPPYKFATDFIYKALDLIEDKQYVIMLLKVQFLEGKARKKLFKKYPPKYIYIHSERQLCAKNGDFETMRKGGGSAVAYAWFMWEKGYKGETLCRWI